VITANCNGEVFEGSQRVAVYGLVAAQVGRKMCQIGAVAFVLGDHQAPTEGVERTGGVGVTKRQSVGEERP
jgi:hypothetical protein